MTDYDTMSVHDLVKEIVKDATGECVRLMSARIDFQTHYVDIESALRKAVIREASVGVGTVERAGDAPLPDAPQMFVPWETKDGDYDLIPKEVK